MAQGIPARRGIQLLFAAAGLGLAVCIFNYFWTGNGIHGSLGALIVIGSTLLMALASAAIALGVAVGRLSVVLAALIFLDILGTGFAAYMLEAQVLFGLMILALLAWLWAVFTVGRPPEKRIVADAAQ